MGLFKKLIEKNSFVTIADLGDIALALERSSTPRYVRQEQSFLDGSRSFLKNKTKELFYQREPLVSAAINKTASKLFFNWFEMDSPKQGRTMKEQIRDDLVQFHTEIELPSKLERLARDAMVFGNGWFELIPANGENNTEAPVIPEQGLVDVQIAEPLYFTNTVEWINKKTGEFYYVQWMPNGEKIRWHHTRLIHVPWHTLGTSLFGIGIYERAYRSMIAKLNLDWAIGEIIYRFGKPFIVLKTTGATKKEIQKAYQILQKLNPRTGFAGTERHEFNILNPSAVDPNPFTEFYYINCAAAVEMPVMVFKGTQKGAVTGSEVDLSDWYSTLASKQRTMFTPVINRINNQYLQGKWRDAVFWNPIFVDEKNESEIFKRKAETIEILFAKAGIITEVEARQIARDWGFPIPDDDTGFEEEPGETVAEGQPEWIWERKLGEKLIREGAAG